MLTLEHALRRSVVTLGLLAAAGTAAAQGTPPADDETTKAPEQTPAPTTPPDDTAPVQTEVDVDVNAPPSTYTTPPPTYTTPVYPEPEETSEGTLERYGIAVTLGGGVEGFVDSTMDDITNVGGSWDVRVSAGTRWPVTFEGSYIGSAQSIDALGLDTNAVLIGNGAQAALRVNLLDMNIQPFALAGAAWRHYSLTNNDFNTSDISDSDDVFELPLGVGVEYKYRGLILDARGEFRFSWGGDMVPEFEGDFEIGDSAGMDRWGVNANIGYAF